MDRPVTDLPNAASVAIVRESKVLLIKRAYAPYQQQWTLPGGRIEPGETIEQCAIREVQEELNITIRNPRAVMEQTLGREGTFRLAVFATRDFSGVLRASDEIADHKWIDPSALIALRTTSRLDDVLVNALAAPPPGPSTRLTSGRWNGSPKSWAAFISCSRCASRKPPIGGRKWLISSRSMNPMRIGVNGSPARSMAATPPLHVSTEPAPLPPGKP